MPSFCACGTVMSTNFWRRSSLLNRLIPHAMFCAVWPCWAASPESSGPNIIRAGHHHRLAASWAIAFCSSGP